MSMLLIHRDDDAGLLEPPIRDATRIAAVLETIGIRFERWPANRSKASRRTDGEPMTSSISSGANRTVRSAPTSAAARRATPFTRIRFRAPPLPVRASTSSIVSVVVRCTTPGFLGRKPSFRGRPAPARAPPHLRSLSFS